MYASPYQRTTDTQMKQPYSFNIGNEIKEGKNHYHLHAYKPESGIAVILRSVFYLRIHIATHFIWIPCIQLENICVSHVRCRGYDDCMYLVV